MALTWAWCGATTPSGFAVSAKIAGASARLATSTSSDLSNPTYHAPVAPNGLGVVRIQATGLAASTRYYWAVEDDGALDLDWSGQAKTDPTLGQPGSFTFGVSSCAGLTGADPGGNDYITNGVSNRPVFDDIRTHLPDFFVHQGDLHYRNIATADITLYRTAFNDVLTYNGTQGASARQGMLYRNVPVMYQWDDHCYGANNSDGTSVSKLQAAQTFREIVPHEPLAQPDVDQGIYRSKQVGRVLLVLLDDRFYRDPNINADGPSHTMLGTAQKTWLSNLLSSSDAEYLIVFSQVDWLRDTTVGADNWGGFATERAELVQLFSGWLGRMHMHIGDRHTMGFCSGGSNNPWGGFPVYMYSGLDSNPGVSEDARYDLGITGGRNRYGLVEVDDQGHQIVITNTGYIGGTVWNTHTVTVSVTPPTQPDITPVGAAKPRTRVTWLSCDAATGTIIAELPEIVAPVSRVLGAYTSSSATLPIPLAGPGSLPITVIEAATEPARSMLVAVVNDVPIYAGLVIPQEGGTEATLQLGSCRWRGIWIGVSSAPTRGRSKTRRR